LNLESMRQKFVSRSSGLADDEDDSVVNDYLNRWYQYHVPAVVGGDYTRGLWELTCVASQSVYDYESHVIAPSGKGVFIGSSVTGGSLDSQHRLDVETDYVVWNTSDRIFPEQDGLPDTILIYGRKVYLSPTPDTDYIVSIPGHVGPSAALTSSGLTNENHAMSVVAGAVSEFLADSEDTEGSLREAEWFKVYSGFLRESAFGLPRHRSPMRSYK